MVILMPTVEELVHEVSALSDDELRTFFVVFIDNVWRSREPLMDAESEAGMISDWLAASTKSLTEVWDNDEDAVYDRL